MAVIVLEPTGRTLPRRAKIDMTLDHAVNTSAVEQDIAMTGRIEQIFFKVPVLESGHTAELIIHDEGGNPIFRSGGMAQSATHTFLLDRLICQSATLRIETSGAQTANRSFSVTLQYS